MSDPRIPPPPARTTMAQREGEQNRALRDLRRRVPDQRPSTVDLAGLTNVATFEGGSVSETVTIDAPVALVVVHAYAVTSPGQAPVLEYVAAHGNTFPFLPLPVTSETASFIALTDVLYDGGDSLGVVSLIAGQSPDSYFPALSFAVKVRVTW